MCDTSWVDAAACAPCASWDDEQRSDLGGNFNDLKVGNRGEIDTMDTFLLCFIAELHTALQRRQEHPWFFTHYMTTVMHISLCVM